VFLPDILDGLTKDDLKNFREIEKKQMELIEGKMHSDEYRVFEFRRLIATGATFLLSYTSLFVFSTTTDSSIFDSFDIDKLSKSFTSLLVVVSLKFVTHVPDSTYFPRHVTIIKTAVVASTCSLLLIAGHYLLFAIFSTAAGYYFNNNQLYTSSLKELTIFLGILYCSVFSGYQIELMDVLFSAAFIFILQIGRYRPGAVKLASMFNFMYLQVCLLTFLTLMANLESYNFSETVVMWNEFPQVLRELFGKIMVYMGLMCLFLSGIQQVCHFFQSEVRDAPDKYSLNYGTQMVVNLTVLAAH